MKERAFTVMIVAIHTAVFELASLAAFGLGWWQIVIAVAVFVALFAWCEIPYRIEKRREDRRMAELRAEARRKIDPSEFDFSKLKDASEIAKLDYDQIVALLESPWGRENARREVEAFYEKRRGEAV